MKIKFSNTIPTCCWDKHFSSPPEEAIVDDLTKACGTYKIIVSV